MKTNDTKPDKNINAYYNKIKNKYKYNIKLNIL